MKVSVSFKSFVGSILRLPQHFLDAMRSKAESFYIEPKWCKYPPFGMYILGVARHACSSENLTRFHRELCEYGANFWMQLGFEQAPTYSNLAHFFNTRIAGKASELVDEGTKLLEQACLKAGLVLGQIRSTDGKVMASTHKNAVFNPHYKKTMFKGMVDWDLKLLAPLKSYCASGTADERPFAKKSHELLAQLKTELDVLDGGYYSFEMYCLNVNTPTLVYFPEGTAASENPEEELLQAYRKHWRDVFYEIGASAKRQAQFLLKRQEYEAVGRYYRDLQILESISKPEEYFHKKHVRSLVETGNSLLDDRGLAKRIRHASEKQSERDLHWTCHALQIQRLTQF